MTAAGFSHSETQGSTLTSSSPWLIAGSHVLHRLSVPRHSPCALSSLTSSSSMPPPLGFGSLEWSALWVVGFEVLFITSTRTFHGMCSFSPEATPSLALALFIYSLVRKQSRVSAGNLALTFQLSRVGPELGLGLGDQAAR